MSTQAAARSSRILLYAAGLLLLLVLAYQFSSLYYFPQYDGARYWGDEFGQIIELKHEIEHGYAAIPTGRSATVAVTNGIVRGNSWLAAVAYGIPAALFYPSYDLVSIGRTVTAVLSLGLLLVLFANLRKFGSSVLVSLAALLLLVTNRSFLFASHSARLDIAAGLAVLCWTCYCTWLYREKLEGRWSPSLKWYLGFGAATFALGTFSIHLLTLLGPVAIFALIVLSKGDRTRAVAVSGIGVVIVAALLLGTNALTGAPFTLFGQTAEKLQSHDVLNAMPAFSPFSWSVQSSNLIQRFEQFRAEAPFIAALFVGALALAVIKWHRLQSVTRFAIACCLIIILSWLEFQSSAVYYLLHITPLMVFVAVMILRTLKPRRWKVTLAMGCVALVLLHVMDIRQGMATARTIEDANQKAIDAVRSRIPNDGSRVLAQYPAVSYLHRDLGDRLMTTHFLNFPLANTPPLEVLRNERVSSMILYRTSAADDYSFEVGPLWQIARSTGSIDTVITGLLFDVGVDYFSPTDQSDTLYFVKLP